MFHHPHQQIAELLKNDPRYKLDAYGFVFDALEYAHNTLQMGQDAPSEPIEGAEDDDEPKPHITGQELSEAVRLYALEQYGFMAKTVLNSWGIRSTGDIGEIVFNLIRIGRMRKTSHDRIEDFQDVYDFDVVFDEEFKIDPTSP
jgi:uncharacterized repeat protein (TIGR04138 family)